MDDQAKFEALRSEFEVEPGYLVRPDGTSKLVYVRAVQDAGGLVRLDISADPKDGEQLQLVIGAKQLMARLSDPQEPLPQ